MFFLKGSNYEQIGLRKTERMAIHYKDFRRRNFSPEKYEGNCLFLSAIVNEMEVLLYKTAEVLSEISLVETSI